APTGADLQSSLSSIMLEITGGASSATRPVRSPGIGLADNTMKAFRLLTSYDPTRGVDGLWYGNIERMRWTCETGVPEEQEKLESSGDDFHRNVALNLGQRQFVTFIPDVVGGLYRPTETLRPHYGGAPDDGAGTRGGTQVTGLGTGFSATVPAGALELNYVTDAACTSTGAGDDNTCRTRVLDWTLGYD